MSATTRRLVQIAFDFTPKPTSFHRGAKSTNESRAAETSTAFESSTTRGQVVRPRFERSTIFRKTGTCQPCLAKSNYLM